MHYEFNLVNQTSVVRGDRKLPYPETSCFRSRSTPLCSFQTERFAARVSGLASGLALAVRPAGLAEVSGVNGAPQARPAQRDAMHR